MSVHDLIVHFFVVLLCFSTYLINGTLVASKFCQSRMTILYPFVISDSKICARKNLRGKLHFAHCFRGLSPSWWGGVAREHVTTQRPRIWPRRMLELCWAAHSFQRHNRCTFCSKTLPLLCCCLLACVFLSSSLFVPGLCSALWVSLFLLGALPPPLKRSSVIPGTWSDHCLFSSQKHFLSCISLLFLVMLVTPVRFYSCFDFVFPCFCFPCLFACSVGSYTLQETKLSSSPLTPGSSPCCILQCGYAIHLKSRQAVSSVGGGLMQDFCFLGYSIVCFTELLMPQMCKYL